MKLLGSTLSCLVMRRPVLVLCTIGALSEPLDKIIYNECYLPEDYVGMQTLIAEEKRREMQTEGQAPKLYSGARVSHPLTCLRY